MTQSFQQPKILCLDYGTSRVGVALSYGTLAEPMIVLANDAQLEERIASLCQEHRVTQIVVGESEGEMANKAHLFGEQLKKKIPLPVVYHDETLSTWTATQKHHQLKSSPIRTHVDAMAAAEILQDYLDTST